MYLYYIHIRYKELGISLTDKEFDRFVKTLFLILLMCVLQSKVIVLYKLFPLTYVTMK